jgi:hypothetical protein
MDQTLRQTVTDNSKILHPYVKKNGVLIKQSQQDAFPENCNELVSWRRIPSKSALQTNTTITNGQNVDFEIKDHAGHTHSIYLELTLRETGNVSAGTVYYPLIFERIEIYVNGSKQLLHSLYPDEVGFLNFLNIPFEELRRMRQAVGIDSTYTPTSGSLPQNGTNTYLIKLPFFQSQPDLRLIQNGVMIRFYFNGASVFSTGSTSVQLDNFNLILRQINIPVPKYNQLLRHRYINHVRNVQSLTMAALSLIHI